MLQPSVAVILVNWNGYEYTVQCLQSLRKLDYSNFTVILVDNASTDGSLQKIKQQFSDLVFIENRENTGFTGGNNTGMAYALEENYEYICLLNNDTEVETDFLKVLVAEIENDPGIGAVQPKIRYNHNRAVIWNAGGFFRGLWGTPVVRGENRVDRGQYEQSSVVEWVTGCCILVKASTVRECGPLNDRYFAYFEDVEWSFRIRKSGKRLVYLPKAIIYHEAGVASKTKEQGKEGFISPFAHYLNVRNHLYLVRQHSRVWFWPTILLAQLVKLAGYVVYFTVRRRFQKLKASLRGFRDGLLLPLNGRKKS